MEDMLQLPLDVVKAPVLSGAGSILAIIVGVAAVVGVSSLHKHAASCSDAQKLKKADLRVGLLRIHVPQNFRDLVKNDVLLEKAIELVSQTLFIFVSGRNKHEVVNYISELYGMSWDVACAMEKPFLNMRIVGDGGSKTWEELVLQPELNAVFGEDAKVDVHCLNAPRFERDGLFAVTYYPLAMHVERRLAADVSYFENEHTDLTPHNLVILGGTFDHLHNGHKKLLSLAVSICANRMLVGVTAQSMLTNKSHAELLEPLEKRKSAVRDYIAFLNPRVIVDIVKIEDPFGPAVVIPEPAAMVVSSETLAGAAKINSIRVDRGLPKLYIFACRRTESSTLSSTCIREKLRSCNSGI
ncbi:bifunctional coenzyme a synthase [Plasmopara halstedii]|uniref:Bifunctional coenzyme a synthase n=1 Tax=Plasmopara halstedii TaxID=4781 RepID=A0A0P1ADJ2_PLAHL|nr:bifunctional coenzyme a synthase [Plasmopara halstedii]CEG38591.1 bifunctional coenzyme a synthase [Plasmopara halstedii]|eukprot:XP_024574960.1 bifunctional coenzyme a synthase [Plasmopara halstedii]